MRFFSRRVIANFAGDPYLIRYTIFSCPWFGIFVHCILRSDDDRDLHDHPWNFWSLILRGTYREYVPVDWPPSFTFGKGEGCHMITKSKVCSPGSLARHKARDAHRLELGMVTVFDPVGPAVVPVLPYRYKPVWTLFLHGPRKREWGFYTPQGWIHWKKYVERDHQKTDVAPMED